MVDRLAYRSARRERPGALRDEAIESLQIGAEDMLATQVPFEPESTMIIVDVPSPDWAAEAA